MLNVKTLTDTMSRMELPQLQQYAALHKNDPYIVTLALSIANQKKQMKAGQAGQAGMMPQPKVVDQELAQMTPQQMLPEDSGIGTLPAQNMQHMAEGGIVAFDDGGSVPGYAGGVFTGGTTAQVGQLGYEQLVKLFQTDPELARQAALRAGPTGQRFLEYAAKATRAGGAPFIVGGAGAMLSDIANRDVARMTPEQRRALSSNPMLSAMSGDTGLAAAIQNAPTEKAPTMGYFDQMGKALSFIPKTVISAPGDKDSPKGYGLTRLFADGDPAVASAATTRAAAPAASPALPPNATQVMSGLSAAAAAKSSAAKPAAAVAPVADVAKPPITPVDPLASLPSLKTTAISADQAKKDAATLSDDTELRNALTANEGFVKGAYDKLLGDYDKKVTEMPEAYKGYEARLKKEEDAASTDKDKALGMSIFRAGLGMLAGTSQYAFENIGKGALTGLEDYQSALKDLKKAQRERDKAFADIEQARLAEKRGDLKTHTELQAKGIEALGSAKNRTVYAFEKIFDVNTRTATGIFETGMKELAQNQRTIYTAAVDFKKQDISDAAAAQRQRDMDAAAMQRINAQVAGSLAATRMNADAFKLPMLYKSVEDSVDKMLQADINYKTADEVTKTTMRNAALKKRLLATPGLAQYADATTGGGSAPELRYNPQTGKIE